MEMQSVCVTKTGGFVDATNVARPSCQRLVVFTDPTAFHWALKPLGAHTTIAQTLLMPDFHTGWCWGSLPNGYFLSHSSLNQNLSVAYMLLSQLLFTLLWVVSIYSILVNAREKISSRCLTTFSTAYINTFTHTLYEVVLSYEVPISRSQSLKVKETE